MKVAAEEEVEPDYILKLAVAAEVDNFLNYCPVCKVWNVAFIFNLINKM